MIELVSIGPTAYRVSAAYVVFDKQEARLLDTLLTHLSALAHDIQALDPAEDAQTVARLRGMYGYDVESGDDPPAALRARVAEECVTLLRALEAARTADSIRPLAVPPAIGPDAPALHPALVDRR